jgi:hypothetical protein
MPVGEGAPIQDTPERELRPVDLDDPRIVGARYRNGVVDRTGVDGADLVGMILCAPNPMTRRSTCSAAL